MKQFVVVDGRNLIDFLGPLSAAYFNSDGIPKGPLGPSRGVGPKAFGADPVGEDASSRERPASIGQADELLTRVRLSCTKQPGLEGYLDLQKQDALRVVLINNHNLGAELAGAKLALAETRGLLDDMSNVTESCISLRDNRIAELELQERRLGMAIERATTRNNRYRDLIEEMLAALRAGKVLTAEIILAALARFGNDPDGNAKRPFLVFPNAEQAD